MNPKRRRSMIKIIPFNKSDRKNAKLMQEMLNADWDKYKDIIEAITTLKMYLWIAYAVEPPQKLFDDILKEVVEMEIKDYKTQNETKPVKNRSKTPKTSPISLEEHVKE